MKTIENTIHFVLTNKWYDLIENEMKTIEYREINQYWLMRIEKKRISKQLLYAVAQISHTKETRTFVIEKIEILTSGINTNLKMDVPVYAIHITPEQIDCKCSCGLGHTVNRTKELPVDVSHINVSRCFMCVHFLSPKYEETYVLYSESKKPQKPNKNQKKIIFK